MTTANLGWAEIEFFSGPGFSPGVRFLRASGRYNDLFPPGGVSVGSFPRTDAPRRNPPTRPPFTLPSQPPVLYFGSTGILPVPAQAGSLCYQYHKGLGEGAWGRIVSGPVALSPLPQRK